VTLLALCSIDTASARNIAQLPPAVTHALEEYRIPQSGLSVFVQDARTDEVILALNSEVPRKPASTIKVLTTIAALDTLGPAHTWTTRAYATAPIKQGVLNGDLVIVGAGDPYLTAERWWSFVNQLRQTGLTTINGDFVIDRSLFAPLIEDRASFDQQPQRSYNVVPDALMVNFQTSTFTIGPGADPKLASINVDPLPANLILNNSVRLSGDGCRRAQQGLRFETPQGPSGNSLTIRGTAPRTCGRYSVTRAVMSAPEFAYGTFRTLWEQSGGTIKGKLRLEPLPSKAHLTTESGRRAVHDWLTEKQIDIPGFVLDNGSGLSREERITAHGLGQILHAGWHSQYMPEFVASLPLAGTDGTLRNRFNAAGMRGRIRMKTGHMDDVSSLAGYVNAVSGNNYIVSIVVNSPGAEFGTGDDVQAALLKWVFAQ
jgi:D-alanyl-D-alanine carboxypeptidase/D-alanyl-D-alanine-endopeptidase (penicillin-binding protein 4)